MAKQTEANRCLSLFLILSCVYSVIGGFSPQQLTRSLKVEYICDDEYPACTPSDDASFPNLVHVTASGPTDTLHYLIGTIGVPTLLVARTTTNASMHVNLDHLMTGNYSQIGNDTITFDPEPMDVYAVLFTTVYEYNDLNDTADLGLMDNDTSYWRHHHLGDLQWLPSVEIMPNNSHIVSLNVSREWTADANRTDPFFFQNNGSFSLKFEFKATNDRNDELPRLEFNANNTQVEVVFDDLDPAFNSSRFALEFAMISSGLPPREMNLTKTKSIDDEYTPGVFEMVDWTTHLNATTGLQSSGGYLQWKPVCYKSPSRSIQAVTKQFYYDLVSAPNATAAVLDLSGASAVSLARAYFGLDLLEPAGKLSVSATNVSFGLSKDKFYRDTNYTISTFSIGYGIPPTDQVSLMIKLVIAIGLGVPVVLIIAGGIGVCVKKTKEKRENDFTSSYQAIN